MDSAVAIGLSVLVIKLIESTAIRPKVYFLMFRIYLVPSCRRVEWMLRNELYKKKVR